MTSSYTRIVKRPLVVPKVRHRVWGLSSGTILYFLLMPIAFGQQGPTKIEAVHYPKIAQQARLAGIITIDARIAPDGTVAAVTKAVPEGLLAKAAEDAVKRWRFHQPLAGQKNTVSLTFEFRLSGECKKECCNETFAFEYPDRALVISEVPHFQPNE